MPIDDRGERASAIGIDLPWYRVYPLPHTDVATRQQAAYKYAGIHAASSGETIVAVRYRALIGVGA